MSANHSQTGRLDGIAARVYLAQREIPMICEESRVRALLPLLLLTLPFLVSIQTQVVPSDCQPRSVL